MLCAEDQRDGYSDLRVPMPNQKDHGIYRTSGRDLVENPYDEILRVLEASPGERLPDCIGQGATSKREPTGPVVTAVNKKELQRRAYMLNLITHENGWVAGLNWPTGSSNDALIGHPGPVPSSGLRD